MAVRYKLILRKDMSKGAADGAKLYYPQAVNNGYVPFDELCGEISDMCTLTSADVKAVLDRMNYILDRHLKAGRIVQFGEIGNFRRSVGGSGSKATDDFKASQIRKPRIVFTPGKMLQTTRVNSTFEQLHKEEGKEGENKG